MSLSSAIVRRPARGFTLVELMITVMIVGILAAVAFPAYFQSVRKARRADAKAALLDLAQREERYQSTANTYTTSGTALGYGSGVTLPMNVLSGKTAYYTMSVTLNSAATTFSATASPISSTDQNKDTQCSAFTITNTGAQTVSGSGSAADCW